MPIPKGIMYKCHTHQQSIPYKKAAKRPPATATKLIPNVAAAALETVEGLELVAELIPLVLLAPPVAVELEPMLEVPLLDMVLLTTAGSMVAL
jgi:hypothetical protein